MLEYGQYTKALPLKRERLQLMK